MPCRPIVNCWTVLLQGAAYIAGMSAGLAAVLWRALPPSLSDQQAPGIHVDIAAVVGLDHRLRTEIERTEGTALGTVEAVHGRNIVVVDVAAGSGLAASNVIAH